MPVSTVWDNEERTILRTDFQGEWTIEDYHATVKEVALNVSSQSHRVYSLTDLRDSALPPLGILWQARNLFNQLPRNFGGCVVVSSNTFVINVVETMNALYIRGSAPLTFVTTLDDAYKTIQKWMDRGS